MGELSENGVDRNEAKRRQQYKKVTELSKKPLKKEDTWCLIEERWYNQWEKYAKSGSMEIDQETLHPGPIDNKLLLEEDDSSTCKRLREHLVEDIDYILLPEEAWDILVDSFGVVDGQPKIDKKVVEKGSQEKENVIEIYPIKLRLCTYKNKDAVVTKNYSVTTTIDELEADMKKMLDIPNNQDTRLWNAYINSNYENMKEKTKTIEEYSLQKNQMVVIEEKNSDGSWPHDASTSHKGGSFFSKLSNYKLRNGNSSTHKTRKITPGLCGLNNLGNTCFMNSALQCLSNVPALTCYFKGNDYKKDLNLTNPLGMKGKIATAYAELIKAMWSGEGSAYAPRDFKMAVGQFQSRFLGYQQQDSQELLAFLTDGLHEDLNRISKKPYVEVQDADGRADDIVAKEAWDNHLKRNDSHIVETLHGLFRSTVDCPECPRVSVTFDPFCFLSLPLPVKRERIVECVFVPMDYTEEVTRYKVTVPKSGVMKDICKQISQYNSVPFKNMTVTDIYNGRFHKIFQQSDQIRGIYDKDFIYVFETPDDVPMLPVYMRNSSFGGSWQLFGQPVLVPVSLQNTTYKDLCRAILRATYRYFSDEDLKKDVEKLLTGHYHNDSDLVGDKVSMESDVKEDETEHDLYNLFRIKNVNSAGSLEYHIQEDSEEPLKLSVNTYISADWTKEAYTNYFSNLWLSIIKTHESAQISFVKKKPADVHLLNCMELFTSKEQLGEDNTWYCSNCKEHQQAYKKFDLWMLPPILIIHFKRFSNNRWSRDKLDTFVDFPTRDLDLTDFVVNPHAKLLEKKRRCYNLIAVSNHYGGLGGGHYTAFAKNCIDKKWHYFDDSSVSESSEERVVTKAAYMLVYQRQDVEMWTDEHPDKPFTFMEPMFSPRAMGMATDASETPFHFNSNSNHAENNRTNAEDLLNNNNTDDIMDTS